jgi:hypothetical protein
MVNCDLCGKVMTFDPNGYDVAPVMRLAPGLIYYPTKGIGEYNGAEVHMLCAVRYQDHCVEIGVISFDG